MPLDIAASRGIVCYLFQFSKTSETSTGDMSYAPEHTIEECREMQPSLKEEHEKTASVIQCLRAEMEDFRSSMDTLRHEIFDIGQRLYSFLKEIQNKPNS